MQAVGYDWTVVMCMLLKRKGRCMKGMPPASMYYIDERQKRIYGAALLGPPSPPHPMVSPLPLVVPCGVGSPLPLPTVVAVGCAPFHGYCWLGVWRPVAKGLDLRM